MKVVRDFYLYYKLMYSMTNCVVEEMLSHVLVTMF